MEQSVDLSAEALRNVRLLVLLNVQPSYCAGIKASEKQLSYSVLGMQEVPSQLDQNYSLLCVCSPYGIQAWWLQGLQVALMLQQGKD